MLERRTSAILQKLGCGRWFRWLVFLMPRIEAKPGAAARQEVVSWRRLPTDGASEPFALERTGSLGAVAQLGERGLCKPEVVGSIPISSTVLGVCRTVVSG
jgi:hypothetical protein